MKMFHNEVYGFITESNQKNKFLFLRCYFLMTDIWYVTDILKPGHVKVKLSAGEICLFVWNDPLK